MSDLDILVARPQLKQAVATLHRLDFGFDEGFSGAADAMLEMYDAVERRKVMPTQPRSFRTTTTTTLADFAREVMLPLIAQPVTH